MLWQILIVTETTRGEMLAQLHTQLKTQIDALGLKSGSDIDVSTHVDHPGQLYGKPAEIGEMREYLRQKATGDYINFIDSDDLISPDYISSIFPLLDGVDYVGFDVQCFTDHTLLGTASHSLQHGKWEQHKLLNGRVPDQFRFCRDISHLNPMRRDLALRAPMSGGIGEDCRWANALRSLGVVKREHYIPRILYWYLWRGRKLDSSDAHDPWRLKMIEDLNAHNPAQV